MPYQDADSDGDQNLNVENGIPRRPGGGRWVGTAVTVMAGSWKVATVLPHVATCARTPHPFKQNPPVADILRLTGSGVE
jgi:hypothetical protein